MTEETQFGQPIRVANYRRARISVTAGVDAGLTLYVAGREMRLGTAPDKDFVVTDQTLSRHRSTLTPTRNGLRIRDDGSATGVSLWGKRV